MEWSPLGCQVCLIKFQKLSKLKKHIYSQPHREKMVQLFGKDVPGFCGFIPFIVLMESLTKRDIKGLSLLTWCFCRESVSNFYLCHICEEKCSQDSIMYHLFTGDHCSNYFNYTNPDVLRFCWVPKKDMKAILRPPFAKNLEDNSLGTLQILDLPKNLYKKLERSTYSEVMHTLRENDKLNECLEAVKPKRTMIQTYQRNSKRKNPLLGMQHIVECICDGPTEKRYYLCTLCNLTLATHMIIKHVLSFDHVYNYFKVWHPSTLASKESCKDYKESVMLHLAKQTLEMFGAPNNEMKQVSLEASEFTSVNFACYEEALKKLEDITKKNKGINLITSIKPGLALEMEAPCCTPSATITCQNCDLSFENIHIYLDHLSKWRHNQMLNKLFANRARRPKQGTSKPHLGLYRYLKKSLMENQNIVGVSLVVACVTTEVQAETIYVCFACQDSFPESILREHFKSVKHLIQTMLYCNPWRLPFAWENGLDVRDLSSKAWEEEQERTTKQIKVKVLDVPYWIFCSLIQPTYEKVMKRLELQHTVLKRHVPHRETYSKLQQNERFPLLGQQFIVMYNVEQKQSTKVAFLCLLCERTLSDIECHAHVFSREHVKHFLDRHHPGSMTSGINAETLLDLAKQAGRINPISTIQAIKLDSPIWDPCPYHRAICILASAKRRAKKGALEPPITPKMKLVPRETVKEMDKDHVRVNGQNHGKMTERSANKTSQTSTDKSDTVVKKFAVDVSTLNSNKDIKSEADGEKRPNKDTLGPSDKRVCPETRSEKINSAGNDTCVVIKEEKREKPITIKPSGDVPGSHQNKDNDDGAETEKEKKISKDGLTECKNHLCDKRPDIKSEHLERAICRDEPSVDEAENSKPSHETATNKAPPDANPQPVDQLWQYIKRKSRDPVVGLNGLFECHCNQHDTIYLCEYCSEKIPEKNIISHVTGLSHQKMYLEGIQKLPTLSRTHCIKEIRHLAVKSECSNGYGDAQVVDLDEEVYCNILKQDFKSAIQTLRSLQAQQQSRHDVPSVSTLPRVHSLQHVNASVTLSNPLDTQVSKFGVLKMKTDNDADDAGSALPETSSKATGVSPKSTKAVTFAHTKVPEPAGLAVPGSGDTVPKSGTNTTTLHPDCTERISKDGFAPRTSVEPQTSKILGTNTALTQTTFPPPKIENTSKYSEAVTGPAVASQTMATPVASAKAPKTLVKSENTDASAKTLPLKNLTVDVAPHEHKSYPPAAIPSTPPVSVRGEQTGMSTCKIGVNQLIVVSCQRSQQVYCQLCSVRLATSSHPSSSTHKYNYVKMKYPEWNAKPSELEKLEKIVAHLVEVEKDVECRQPQILHVNKEEYRELAALPESKAIEKVKAKIAKGGLSISPTSTADNVEALRQQVAFTSPCEVSSPDDEVYMSQKEVSGFSAYQQSKKENEHKPQNWTDRDPEAKDMNPGPLHSHPASIKSYPKHIPAPGIQEPDIAVTIEQETLAADLEANSSECATSAPHLSKRKDLSENGHQKERRYSELQETPPIISSSTDTISPGASVITEQQNQSRPSDKTERVLPIVEYRAEPVQHSASQVLPKISIGESSQGCSNLSKFLAVKKLDKPIIGLGSVWECQGISDGMAQKSFYLCECCREKLAVTDICSHMGSSVHLYKCMITQYSKFTDLIDENVPQDVKLEILIDAAKMISKRESFKKIDAQVVILRHDLHERVQKAHFSEALRIVQNIKEQHNLKVFCPPVIPPQQKEVRQKSEKHKLEETAMIPDLDGIKRKKASSPQLLNSVSPKAATCVSPQETHGRISAQLELRPTFTLPELQGKQPFVFTVSPQTSQNRSVSPKIKSLTSRKRPAVTAVETLLPSSLTNNAELEGPSQAKCARISLQPDSQASHESTIVNTPATTTPLSSKDKGTRPRYDGQNGPNEESKNYDLLVALVKEAKSKVWLGKAAPDDSSTSAPATKNSSESVAEQRLDSKCHMVKVTKLPPSKKTLEEESTSNGHDLPHQSSVSAQSVFGNVSQLKPGSVYLAGTNTDQNPEAQSNVGTDNSGICQMPINPIITARPDPVKRQSMGGYKGQVQNELNKGTGVPHHLSSASTTNPTDPSGGFGQCSQRAVTAGPSGYLSSETVPGYATPGNPPVCTEGSYTMEGYSQSALYPSQVYSGQEGMHLGLQSFGQTIATSASPCLMSLEIQVQQLHQQVMAMQQQQQQQQQYPSGGSAALPAADGKVTNDAGYTVPLSTAANNPPRFSTNSTASPQNSRIPGPTAPTFLTVVILQLQHGAQGGTERFF
ncbi:hypothetical protein Q5P01_018263 [Channa striata]|uniref:C2H2-type domain-containing protein n=1 Tax=Channa striata TaxID=64152 RepID=A0AA88S9L3_CHASR|nr:hypothetical protein Q5P01_018263 [Channa striata]